MYVSALKKLLKKKGNKSSETADRLWSLILILLQMTVMALQLFLATEKFDSNKNTKRRKNGESGHD